MKFYAFDSNWMHEKKIGGNQMSHEREYAVCNENQWKCSSFKNVFAFFMKNINKN